MTIAQVVPVLGRKTLTNTYRYAGGTVSILLDGQDTGGQFSVWEAAQKPGGEPPLHVHHTSDETFYILEGRMRFMIAGEIRDAGPGDIVFAPRGIPHTFRVKSAVARAITICTPSGFEQWFRQLGELATSFDLPDCATRIPENDFPKMLDLAKQLHVEIVPTDVDF